MQLNHDASNRYAALAVTVSYLGRSRTYNSLWLFGGANLLPIDLIVGNSVLATIATKEVVPNTLLEGKLYASSPGVRSWLQTHQLPDAAHGQSGMLPSFYRAVWRDPFCGIRILREVSASHHPHATIQP
jgi:hypothetical protein